MAVAAGAAGPLRLSVDVVVAVDVGVAAAVDVAQQ